MITLGIDCTSEYTSVGVSENGTVIAQISEKLGRRQSSELPKLTEVICTENEKELNSVDLITVAAGPGYYTGIRTGIAYSCALAAALKVKILPICTLELMAAEAHYVCGKGKTTIYVPVIKARKNFVYAACYRITAGQTEVLAEPKYLSQEELKAMIAQNKQASVISSEAMAEELKSVIEDSGISSITLSGGTIALYGEQNCEQASDDYMKIRGLYLREPDIGPTN